MPHMVDRTDILNIDTNNNKNIAVLSISCALTPVISELILALRDTAIKLIRYIQ